MSRQVVDLTIHTPNTNKEMLTYSNWHLIRERNSNERSAAIKLLITTVFELSGMVWAYPKFGPTCKVLHLAQAY